MRLRWEKASSYEVSFVPGIATIIWVFFVAAVTGAKIASL